MTSSTPKDVPIGGAAKPTDTQGVAAGGGDMDTASSSGDEIKATALDEFTLGLCKKPLYAIHPRRANRTVTMWKGAITVQLDDPVKAVFKTLNDENILSAPVIQTNGRFFGFIDMMDIVMFTIRLFGATDVKKESLDVFFQKEDKYGRTTVRELLEQLHPDRNWKEYRQRATVPKDFSLFHAWEAMIRRGRKRLAVVDETQQVYSILTQSMLIGWAYNNIDEALKPIKDLPISNLGYEKPIVSVGENDSAISAFQLMASKGIHGVAVLNAKGELVDVLSIRDLRGVAPTAEEFMRLWRPVAVFKREVRDRFANKTPVNPDLYVFSTDTLKTAIVMMDEDRVHRLFVVNKGGEKKPVGCITQSDVLRYLLNISSGKLFEDDEDEKAAAAMPAQTTPAASATAGPGKSGGTPHAGKAEQIGEAATPIATSAPTGSAAGSRGFAPEMATAPMKD